MLYASIDGVKSDELEIDFLSEEETIEIEIVSMKIKYFQLMVVSALAVPFVLIYSKWILLNAILMILMIPILIEVVRIIMGMLKLGGLRYIELKT